VARESQLERALSVAHIPLTVAWMPVREFPPWSLEGQTPQYRMGDEEVEYKAEYLDTAEDAEPEVGTSWNQTRVDLSTTTYNVCNN